MSKSRKNHVRKMYDLRMSFKGLLASLFFESPLSFAGCFLNGNLENALQGVWGDYVKGEHYNSEVYTTEFAVDCCKGKTDDDLFTFIFMPDIVDVNKPVVLSAYKWHKRLGVGFILYNNLKNNVSRFYVCESSVNGTLSMFSARWEYVPLYYVNEYLKNGEIRNIKEICSNSFEEIKLRFYKVVEYDVTNTCIHSDLWNAILNKAQVEEIKKLIESGADLDEEGSAEDIEKDDNYEIIDLIFDHPDCFELIKLFVENGYDIKKVTKEGVNAVTNSIFCDDPRVFFYLYNLDQNIMPIGKSKDYEGENEYDVISIAAYGCKNPDVFKFLLDKVISTDKNYEHGWGLIHQAVSNPNPQILQMLIDRGVPIENKDYKELKPFQPLDYSIINEPDNLKNLTPLALASIDGTPEICEILIKAGARLEAKSQTGQTPLMLSTKNKNPEVFRLLLKYGANINALDYMKQGVLNHALKNAPLEIVKEIAELTNAHFHNYNYEIYIKNIEKMKAIRYSAQNDPKLFESLIQAGIDINLPKEKKLPFIFLVAENPDLRVLDFLAENGCDLSLGTKEENVVSHALENNSNPNIIDYLMNNNLWIKDDYFISEHIAKNPNVEVWKRLWGIGFPLTYQDENGASLLMKVFYYNAEPDIDVVKFLSYESTVNLKDKNGLTVSHYAAIYPDLRYLTILEQAGAYLGEREKEYGFTSFMEACCKNPNSDVVRFFIEDGFSIRQESFDGRTLAHFAAKNPNPEVMQRLIDYGVVFDREDKIYHQTPLHVAAREGTPEVCQILLDNGCRLEARDRNYCTPLINSTINRNPEVFRFLVKSGANIKVKDSLKNTIIHHALGNSSFELFKEIADLTKTKFDDSNFEKYMKQVNYIDYLCQHWNSLGIPFYKKEREKLPFILCAALNPDIRVLDYLKEKGCNIFAGNFEKNVIAYALINNTNPNMVNYLLGNKIDNKLYDLVFENIYKNTSVKIWDRVFNLGFPYEYQDEQDTTLLMKVLKNNPNPEPNVVGFLSHEKTVNLKDNYGVTACHYAAQKDDVIYLQILHSRGAKINERENYQNTTPLMVACCKSSNPAIIDFLVKNGANINERCLNGNDALLYAAINPNPKNALYLIKELKADIHTKDREGRNILMEAIRAQSNDLVKVFIDLGVDVNEKDNYGYASIVFAAHYNPSIEILDLLIKKGADINYKNDKNANLLILAARNNSNEMIIDYFLNKGFNVNYVASDGETPLLAAAQNGNLSILQTLVQKGANFDSVNNYKQNALFIASMFNNKPYIIKYLIEKGLPINSIDVNGNTSVIAAAMNPNVNIIKTLVDSGADLNVVNNSGSNALIAATRQNNPEMIKYLIEKGLDINARNEDNATALMMSAGNNSNPEFVELLIAAGSDINAEDINGDNAYTIAKKYNPNPSVAETIKKYMTMTSFKETPFNIPSTSDIN